MFTYDAKSHKYWFNPAQCENYQEFNLVGVVSFHGVRFRCENLKDLFSNGHRLTIQMFVIPRHLYLFTKYNNVICGVIGVKPNNVYREVVPLKNV